MFFVTPLGKIIMAKRILLIDLDGTLIDTTDEHFKPMKDGVVDTDLSIIPVIPGAKQFLADAKHRGFIVYIVSDSHPRYVKPIYKHLFSEHCSGACSLADKPNTQNVLAFLESQDVDTERDEITVIGDTYLDILMGRGLRAATLLLELYTLQMHNVRDGIGDHRRHLKSGPTFYVKNYQDALICLDNPINNLLCLEAKINGSQSPFEVELEWQTLASNEFIYMALARQAQGQVDRYDITNYYFEFSRPNRSQHTLCLIADAVKDYIVDFNHVHNLSWHWDWFTYMPDKTTTIPPNKMGELFDLICKGLPAQGQLRAGHFLKWNIETQGSTRKQINRGGRTAFVSQNVDLIQSSYVAGKNIIVLDDQYTTGATAQSVADKLREAGAKNILWVSLFYLVDNVESNKVCPQCGKFLLVKVNRSTGERFYSCPSPEYRGTGCGYSEPMFDPLTSKACPRCGKMLHIRKRKSDGNPFYSCVPPEYKGNGCGYIENIVVPRQNNNTDDDIPF